LRMAFQPAWSAAAARTARKMLREMAGPRCAGRSRESAQGIAGGSAPVMDRNDANC
jgi:hypothetical protein